jgi:cobalt-zinc-cadmium resistance protein CzcA
LAEAQHHAGRLLTREERFKTVFEASQEASKPLFFGQLIIMIVYLPILALTGVEGKMFTPMALTVLMALAGAMVLSVTFVPAAVALFVTGKVAEKENGLVVRIKQVYGPLLKRVLQWRYPVVAETLLLVIGSGVLAVNMGKEFIPSLDEGDVVIQPVRIPGTSIEQSVRMQHNLDAVLAEVPEIQTVFSRIGTAEIASDPMSPNEVDTFIIIKPKKEWPDPKLSKEGLIAKMDTHLHDIPGIRYEFTQPIQMRFNELIAGVRSDVGIKIFGDDLEQLRALGRQVSQKVMAIPGASDVKVEQVDGLPILTLALRPQAMARYGLSTQSLQQLVQIALGGHPAGEVFEGDRRFEVVVRLPEHLRTDLEKLRRLPVPLPGSVGPARFIPLEAVAHLDQLTGPNQISREQGKRRIVVTMNVRGRDIGSFVAEAQSVIAQQLTLPTGYWVAWGGQFQQMVSAAQRLQLVVPIALLMIIGLLFMTFGNIKDALIVFSGVPLALTGGIAALWLRQIPLSISAGIGFIALSGVAVLNGLVMITFIRDLRAQGLPLVEAITTGAMIRLRPVLMTALVASLGFVPMALAHGTGAEVQKPLATVVIGGIISSTALTLIVLPVLYRIFHRDPETEVLA